MASKIQLTLHFYPEILLCQHSLVTVMNIIQLVLHHQDRSATCFDPVLDLGQGVISSS
jgi:hypothetical protein